MLADGGEAIGDINALRHQGQVLGPVASAPAVWRALDELTPAALRRIQVARARARRHVWKQLPALPASTVTGTDLSGIVVLDVDATLVTSHSDKSGAAPTFKDGFGYHPLAVWCNTQEMLAVIMRSGNAGTNTVADHIDVLTRAIAHVPASHRKHLLVRADGAGSSHGLLDWLTAHGTKRVRTVEYSVGYATTVKVRDAIARLPRKCGRLPQTPTVTSARAGTAPRSPPCWTCPVGRPGCACHHDQSRHELNDPNQPPRE